MISAARTSAELSISSSECSAESTAAPGKQKIKWWSLCLKPSTKDFDSETPATIERVGDKEVNELEPHADQLVLTTLRQQVSCVVLPSRFVRGRKSISGFERESNGSFV